MALKITKTPVAESKWIEYKVDGETAAKFLIRPASNVQYQVAVERNQLGIRADGFDVRGITQESKPFWQKDAEAVAFYLIESWEGLEDSDGNPIPYTPEKAVDVLTQSRIGLELWAWIKGEAEALQVEAEKAEAEIEKKR